MTFGLRNYSRFPLNVGTLIDPIQVGTGDGTTTAFPLDAGTGVYIGDTVVVDSVIYSRALGGFTVVGDSIVFPSPPSPGSSIVIPGAGVLDIQASDSTGTNIGIGYCYLADADLIHQTKYIATPPNAGILISARDFIVSSGAQVGWFQFALCDGLGAPGTFSIAGASLNIGTIEIEDTTTGSNTGDDLPVTNGSQFIAGMLISINPGMVNQEIVTVKSIISNTITTDGLNFSHLIDEPLYHCGWKVAVKATVPDNIAGHTAVSLSDVGLRRVGRSITRT